MAKTALIISTYNWPQALNLCLKSVSEQSISPNEIIIADDGSGDSTKQIIDCFSKSEKIPVKHIWQEDQGFRLARIRNKAIRNTDCDYLIFVDGDVILHRDFVKDHIKERKEGRFITGSRVLLSEDETKRRLVAEDWIFRGLNYPAKNKLNGIRSCFLSGVFSKNNSGIYNVRGCNMSFWKSDLQEVNGFDEQFTGWGREDSDITIRMLNCSKTKLRLKFKAIQYHLFHNKRERDAVNKNDSILNETISQNRKKAVIGLI
ncbi:glycosyltransferase family 2 protein [Maribellus maritimus]|uniref:glycosyltransferase family 2 protein n=1 Tax=Maribellus maritimus TaxID=2870838 RepID=UPI001EEA17F4|nr:glycosyltransferase family 2 protein [Maribellus maritimus]MCG6188829.1 glycosyltransferase family 2 protein [Maribellus maritimus]